jgi:hypothetical protein
MTTTKPYTEALAGLTNVAALLDKVQEESGGYLDVVTANGLAAQVANSVSIAQVRATLAVADAVGSLDSAVRDLHEYLRSTR